MLTMYLGEPTAQELLKSIKKIEKMLGLNNWFISQIKNF
jgi:hypothetical protein